MLIKIFMVMVLMILGFNLYGGMGTTVFNVSSTTLLATTNGNVGIGTVTPTTKLEVNGNVKANSIQASSFTFNGSQYITGISTDTALNISNDQLIATVNAIKNYVISFANYNPPGTILPYAASTAPSGYLLCDGRSVSTIGTYANLFAVIQYTYGGSGSNFNIPDLRGVFLRGKNNSRNDGKQDPDGERVLGNYQSDNYLSHNHSGNTSSASIDHTHTGTTGDDTPDHSHAYRDAYFAENGGGRWFGSNGQWGSSAGSDWDNSFAFRANDNTTRWDGDNNPPYTWGASTRHHHSFTTVGMNSNVSHSHGISSSGGTETRPKNIAVNYIIKY